MRLLLIEREHSRVHGARRPYSSDLPHHETLVTDGVPTVGGPAGEGRENLRAHLADHWSFDLIGMEHDAVNQHTAHLEQTIEPGISTCLRRSAQGSAHRLH